MKIWKPYFSWLIPTVLLYLMLLIAMNMFLVSVRFEEATYSINENSISPLQPVLLLSQQFPNVIDVTVIAQDGTATGRVLMY